MTDAVSTAPSLPVVPGLPDAGTPFGETAAGLRQPVLEMLDRLLTGRRGKPLPLPTGLDRLMMPPALAETRLREQWQHLGRRLRFINLPAADPMQLLVVHAAFAGRQPDTAAGWLARRLPAWLPLPQGPVGGLYMPLSAWGLLAGLAWDDLGFRHGVAERIQGFVRENHLIPAGQMPVPRLAPETCWLLLAAAGPRIHRWWHLGYWRLTTRRARTVDHLVSLLVLSAPGWAGFWDWWVLRRLLAYLPDLPERLWLELADALTALPTAPGGEGEPAPLMHPDWAAQWPPWLPSPVVSPSPVSNSPVSIGG